MWYKQVRFSYTSIPSSQINNQILCLEGDYRPYIPFQIDSMFLFLQTEVSATEQILVRKYRNYAKKKKKSRELFLHESKELFA
jgi:hypothetical protein